MNLSPISFPRHQISFKQNKPTKFEEVPEKFDPKYLTQQSRDKTVAILGASRGNEKLDPYKIQAEYLAATLVKRGYNVVTGAATAGIMDAADKGAYSAEIDPENKNHGKCLGIASGWSNEDYQKCHMIKKSKDDFARILDFDKVAKNIVVFPGGTTTMAEATTLITRAKYEEDPEKKPVVSLIGPFQAFDRQYEKFEEMGTVTPKRDKLYKLYDEVDTLIDEKFPPKN